MLTGVQKLLKDCPGVVEDSQYYIDLLKKIQKILDTMPEIQEKKGASEINAI